MITRYNRKWSKPEKKSCPEFIEYERIEQVKPLSYQDEAKSIVKEYETITFYKEKKRSWSDFIKSYDIGSVSDQVLSHIKKGTPLITAHTLPPGDYTPESLKKGADIIREMADNGITLDMLEEAYKASGVSSTETEVNELKQTEGENGNA